MTGADDRTAHGESTPDRFVADAAFAREIAERAGLVLVERYERVGQIDHKSAKDVVTEVDHLSEALIMGAIRGQFPGDGILAEESGEHRGTTAGAATDQADAVVRSLAHGRTWIIDPLDGTVNYANGLPHFCVSVAWWWTAARPPARSMTRCWGRRSGPRPTGRRCSTMP